MSKNKSKQQKKKKRDIRKANMKKTLNSQRNKQHKSHDALQRYEETINAAHAGWWYP